MFTYDSTYASILCIHGRVLGLKGKQKYHYGHVGQIFSIDITIEIHSG